MMERLTFGVSFIILAKSMKMAQKRKIIFTYLWFRLLLLIADSLETNSLNLSKVKNFLEDLCRLDQIQNGMNGTYMIFTTKNIYFLKVNPGNITTRIQTWSDLTIHIIGIPYTESTGLKLILSEKLYELRNQGSLSKNLLLRILYPFSKSDQLNLFSNKLLGNRVWIVLDAQITNL